MQPELSTWNDFVIAAHETLRHWVYLLLMGWLGFVCWALWQRNRGPVAPRRRERSLREELETYARLEFTWKAGTDARPLAKQVCRLVAEKSVFRSVALLLQNAEGRIYAAGSVGMDPGVVTALELWGAQAADTRAGQRVGPKSFLVELAQPGAVQAASGHNNLGAVIVAPLHSAAGRLAGTLAVSLGAEIAEWASSFGDAIGPIETLAAKLGRMLENAALTERLMRVEKLAGLGQLAGGVAHELNNPLTAVLGFAELIAETSAESRVREDANMILTQALRMREIIQNLVNFWRPAAKLEDGLDTEKLLGEMTTAWSGMLEQRGIRLAVAMTGRIPPIRGNPQQLRLMLEHLLNNSAQAILQGIAARSQGETQTEAESSGTPLLTLVKDEEEPPTIRVTVSHGGQAIQLVVSDTGPGFRDPARVFDPFYTTRQPGAGAGLGLSICYGVVREHGGEISAFNLHPHGAAVVVELPTNRLVAGEDDERGSIHLVTAEVAEDAAKSKA
jgi:signal transduction histidine kinase